MGKVSKAVCLTLPLFPVVLSVNMKKGGPRTALNELCQKSQWPGPRIESVECKLRLVKSWNPCSSECL